MGPAITHGWRGIRRGLPQSTIDLELAAPGAGIGLWLGYLARPLLAPLYIRARPLPVGARAVIWGALGLLAVTGIYFWRRR